MTNTILAVYGIITLAGVLSVPIFFFIRRDMEKKRKLQEERESKWCGGAR